MPVEHAVMAGSVSCLHGRRAVEAGARACWTRTGRGSSTVARTEARGA